MKERTVRVLVLAVVFLAAMIGFRIYLNRDNADIIVDMDAVTLPTISFRVEGVKMNLAPGHLNKMDASAVRNTVTPVKKNKPIQLDIEAYDRKIKSLTYTVYERDGKKPLLEQKVNHVEQTLSFTIGDVLGECGEGILCVQLAVDGEDAVYYYTRIVDAERAAFKGCLQFVQKLHSNMIQNKNADEIRSVLETNPQANLSLQHVTIESSPEHAAWATLKPEVMGEVYYQVQETKEEYTSILLRYLVQCAGDDNKGAIYRVNEFFKVRCADQKYYLLAYDRTMEERFTGGEAALSSKGIQLGMANADVEYRTNQDGTVVAFVQANELWSYQEKENEFALVFSFAEAEKEDIRNHFQEHSIKILSMDDDGNVTFAVYGYMNRGDHEGESGAAIYYFDLHRNVVKEVAFIPSDLSYVAIREQFGELAYYNRDQDALYVVADSCLYRMDLTTNERTVVLQDLQEGAYVASEDGQQIAYKHPDHPEEANVLDFATGRTRSVRVEEGEWIQPLGFIKKDFVYGVALEKDLLETASGERELGMYKLEIRNAKDEILKTYQKKGVYILGATFEANRMNLQCAKKKGGVFRTISDDYISNNEQNVGKISLQPYWSEVRGNLTCITFEDGLRNRNAKVLKPKLVLTSHDTLMDFEGKTAHSFYTVYGLGRILAVYKEAGEAIQLAKKVSGTVVSPEQNYVWEEHRQSAWCRNFELDNFAATVNQQLKKKGAAEILEEYSSAETVCIKRCSVSEMRYLIDKGIPVLAMTGSKKAVVLVGYDAQTVTYVEPGKRVARSAKFSNFDSMIQGSGSTFFAYLNNQ